MSREDGLVSIQDRPRILHVVTRDDRRGAETAALALHQALVSRGWNSQIAALAPSSRTGEALGVDVLGPEPLARSTLRRLREVARSVDLVIAHGSTTLPACGLALVRSTPFVYVNIGDPRAWQTTLGRRLRSRALLRRARAVVAITERSAALLTDMLGVPERRLTVIGNFRSSGQFHPLELEDRRAVRERMGLPVSEPLLCYLGALSPEKRPDLALQVIDALPGDVSLVIAGDGPMEAEVRRLVTSGGLDDRVRLVGSTVEPHNLLAASDVLLLTSDTEGVPGVLIEAGLCGTPAVATDVGFVDEVVQDGVTGRLAPADDPRALAAAVAEVLAERERYGGSALTHCREQFEEGVVVSKWEEFLTRVLRHP